MVRTLIVIVMLALLSACGGRSVAGDPPSSSAPVASASPSAAASLAPPVMPALAREHTEAGAKAFVEYYWAVVNHAQSTLDTATLRSLMNPLCTGCNGGLDAIEKIKVDNGAVSGGDGTPAVLSTQRQFGITARLMSLVMRLDIAPMGVTYPSPRVADSYSAVHEKERFLLSEQPTGWQVELIEPLK